MYYSTLLLLTEIWPPPHLPGTVAVFRYMRANRFPKPEGMGTEILQCHQATVPFLATLI